MTTAVIVSIIGLSLTNIVVLVAFSYRVGSKVTAISKDLEYIKNYVNKDMDFREKTISDIADLDKRVAVLESA